MLNKTVPQSTTILVPPEEMRAKLDNITEALLANMARLEIALSLMTEEQIERYNELTTGSQCPQESK